MRIAVIGPQNTGKSTFIQDFISEFKDYTTPEKTYRDVVIENKLDINQKTNERSQELIATFIFDQITQNNNRNILFDRCLIDNYVYSYLAYKSGEISKDYLYSVEKRIYEHLKYLDAIIFIPTAVSVKLVNDDLRDTDANFIDEVNNKFINMLIDINRKYFINTFVISGNREERVSKMREILK